MNTFKRFLFIGLFLLFACKDVSVFAQDASYWSQIQKKSKNAVVQVFSHVNGFDWLQPFKTPEQFSCRGSGFFINDEGYLLTNFHVIDQAAVVYIQIPSLGKEQFEAEYVGSFPEMDIALLKLKDDSLTDLKNSLKDALGYSDISYLDLGDSDDLDLVQEIMILGYPLGQENLKCCVGNIAGPQSIGDMNLIQTTAPVNPGNSGGPALDMEGNVIGISVANIPSAQNVGYFIPISDVKNKVNGLLCNQYPTNLLRKPFLGADLSCTTEDTLKYLNNPVDGGIHVASVIKGSLFKKNGIKKGDVIYQIGDSRVDRFGYVNVDWSEYKVYLYDKLNRFEIGDTVELVVYRNGERIDISFNIEIEEVLPIHKVYVGFEKIDYEIIGGMVVMELTLNHLEILKDSLKKQLKEYDMLCLYPALKYLKGKNRNKSKLVVTHVFAGSEIEQTRCLVPSDILDKVNDVQVSDLEDFRKAVQLSLDDGYLKLETEDGFYSAVNLDKILENEDWLASQYHFTKSKLVEDLAQNRLVRLMENISVGD